MVRTVRAQHKIAELKRYAPLWLRFPFGNRALSAPYKPQPQVLFSMAIHTESDQVADFISAKPASKSQVVDLEVGRRPADLAAPTVTLQYLQSLRMILLRVQLQPQLLPHGLFFQLFDSEFRAIARRRVVFGEVGTGEKVRANHFQAITS